MLELKKLYLVTVDGYNDCFGAEIYTLGIWENYEDAKTASEKYRENYHCIITELNLNELYPLRSYRGELSNNKYLGGYIE